MKNKVLLIGAAMIASAFLAVAAFDIYDGTGVKHLRAPSATAVGQQTGSAVSTRPMIGVGFVSASLTAGVTNFVLQGSADGSTGWVEISNTVVSGATNLVVSVNWGNQPAYIRCIVGATTTNDHASAVAFGLNQYNR